jgi:hypothetical protein
MVLRKTVPCGWKSYATTRPGSAVAVMVIGLLGSAFAGKVTVRPASGIVSVPPEPLIVTEREIGAGSGLTRSSAVTPTVVLPDVVVAVVVVVAAVEALGASEAAGAVGAVGPSAQARVRLVRPAATALPSAVTTRAMWRRCVGAGAVLRSGDMCVFAVWGGPGGDARGGATGPSPGIGTARAGT